VECEGFFLRIRFVLGGNFGLLLKSYFLLTIFQGCYPEKGIFEFLNQFTHFNYQIKFLIFLCNLCHNTLDLFFPNLRILIQGSRPAEYVPSTAYFLKFLEDKGRRFKTNLTLRLILQFNLKLGGYSIWSARFIASYIKEDLKTTQGIATHSLEAAQEVLGRHLQDGV
jgi:hypothetical protein